MQLQRSTKHTKPTDRIERWHVIDAEGERLGRLASRIAGLLQGKHRPDFSRHQLSEDFVIVVNAAKVGFSGNKPLPEGVLPPLRLHGRHADTHPGRDARPIP